MIFKIASNPIHPMISWYQNCIRGMKHDNAVGIAGICAFSKYESD